MNRQSIPWRSVPPNGTPLRGRLLYWEKDYTLILDHPFAAERCGTHDLSSPSFFYNPGGNDKFLSTDASCCHPHSLY
jgi:hypothetical protein